MKEHYIELDFHKDMMRVAVLDDQKVRPGERAAD
jgi:hypothetical protein